MRFLLSILLMIFFISCTPMSETEINKNIGFNGGFEYTHYGIPINWVMYTPNTVPNADFDIVFDEKVKKEGEHSLLFDVRNCEATGGWHSPGFTSAFSEIERFEGSNTFKISYWLKNEDSKYSMKAGGVSAMEGDMRMIQTNSKSHDWEFFVFEVDVPSENFLRIELNVLSPGKLWIDDLKISEL